MFSVGVGVGVAAAAAASSYYLLNEAICLLSLPDEALKHFRFIFSTLEICFCECENYKQTAAAVVAFLKALFGNGRNENVANSSAKN